MSYERGWWSAKALITCLVYATLSSGCGLTSGQDDGACDSQADAGVLRCAPGGGAVQRCKSDDRWGTHVVCDPGSMCQVGADGQASCEVPSGAREPGCELEDVGARRCRADMSGTEQCGEDGTWSPLQTCDASQECVAASAEDAACVDLETEREPGCEIENEGDVRCGADGASTERCAEDGSWGVAQVCLSTQVCMAVSDTQASCVDAPPEREPGCEVENVGDVRCREVGNGVGPGTERCNEDGSWRPLQGCLPDQECYATGEATAACMDTPPEREPGCEVENEGDVRCRADGSGTERCNADGSWRPLQGCLVDEQCVATSSTSATCTDMPPEREPGCEVENEGDVRCRADGSGTEQCNADGSWRPFQGCLQDERCVATSSTSATCTDTPPEREPGCEVENVGDVRCREVGNGVGPGTEQCNADGSWRPFQGCLQDERCVATSSTSATCTDMPPEREPGCEVENEGDVRCRADGSGTEQCNADGSWRPFQGCLQDERCVATSSTSALCEEVVVYEPGCEQGNEGFSRCRADGRGSERCYADGKWRPLQGCLQDQECVQTSATGASCQDVVTYEPGCEPQNVGDSRCRVGINGTESCNADGTWRPRQGCLLDQECQQTSATTATCVDLPVMREPGCDVQNEGDVRCRAVGNGVGPGTERCNALGQWVALQGCLISQECVEPSPITATCQDVVTYEPGCEAGNEGVVRCRDASASEGTERCYGDGQWRPSQGCLSGEVCVASSATTASCVDVPPAREPGCEAQNEGDVRCRMVGNGVGPGTERCNAVGQWRGLQGCLVTQECVASSPTTASCELVVTYEPGCEAQNVGDARCRADGSGTESCRADGKWRPLQGCLQDQECVQAGATTASCQDVVTYEPGCEAQNVGDARCRADGSGTESCRMDGKWRPLQGCLQDQECVQTSATGASCQDVVTYEPGCEPQNVGDSRCRVGINGTESCRADGAWRPLQGCLQDQECEQTTAATASCVDLPPTRDPGCEVQNEGDVRCRLDGLGTESCRADGKWRPLQGCLSDEQCVSASATSATCERVIIYEPGCSPATVGDVRCRENGLGTEQCKESGQWLPLQGCLANEQCMASSAVDASCVEVQTNEPGCEALNLGERRCRVGFNGTEQCKSNGAWAPFQTCLADQTCSDDGTGAAFCEDLITYEPGCAPANQGDTRCNADLTGAERCQSDGKWAQVQTCTMAQACEVNAGGAASCVSVATYEPGCEPENLGATRCTQDLGGTQRCRSSGTWDVVQTCTAEQECQVGSDGSSGCVAVLSFEPGCGPSDVGNTRCSEDKLSTERCRSNGKWELVQACDGGTLCELQDDGSSACDVTPQMMSYMPTIDDTNSPYYDDGCPLAQQQAIPSSLAADCRCFNNQGATDGIPVCTRPLVAYNNGDVIGAGPAIASLSGARYTGGHLDEAGGKLYVGVSVGTTGGAGAVISVDLTSGDRVVLSGTSPAGGTAGSGAALRGVIDVRLAPDGFLYAFVKGSSPAAHEIVKIDKQTGARTVTWRGRDAAFGQCTPTGQTQSLQYTTSGFAIDAQGRFYVPFGNPVQGRGIVRVSANGSSCDVVTGDGTTAYATKGSGPNLGGFVQGFEFKGGVLHAFTTQPKQFFSVDMTTGDRTLLLRPSGVTPPERWARWDSTRDVWWLAGFQNSVTLDAWDPALNVVGDVFNGGVFPWMPLGASGPIQINSLNYGGIWVKANGNLLIAQDGISIVEFEPSTGNSITLSH